MAAVLFAHMSMAVLCKLLARVAIRDAETLAWINESGR